MGRKEKWYSKIKKVLSPGSPNLRIKTQAKQSSGDSRSKQIVTPAESVAVRTLPQVEDVAFVEPNTVSEIATALAPKITLAIMRHAKLIHHVVKSKEDEAAIQIQTAYRGYLARRTLRALRGLVRLKFLAQGQAVQRQAANTLKCMQALARVQSQVCSRRTLVSKENQALRKQLLQKSGKKHTAFRNSEDWKDCAQSKEQEESKLKKKHEAALRRERSLAYSSVHQKTWKDSPKRMSSDTTVTDLDNPSWGWSWLERWMQTAATEGPDSTQEITEVRAQITHNPPPSIKVTPTSHVNPALKVASMAEKSKTGSTRMRLSNASGSENPEKNRRRSFAGSSARDYTSSAASNSPRSHTMPAKSLITRPKSQSPLGMDHDRTPRKSTSVRLAEKPSSHLAPPHSNTTRRHSAPPKVRTMTLTQQNQKITA